VPCAAPTEPASFAGGFAVEGACLAGGGACTGGATAGDAAGVARGPPVVFSADIASVPLVSVGARGAPFAIAERA
jgi:hypothetical protein